jgi:hypothetical protein
VPAEPLIAELARTPERTGLFFDLDGTLSPIVARPEDSFVPDETRDEIERLAARYRLVACVTGRAGSDARRILGVDTVTYVGEHGLELEPEAERWRAPLALFLTAVSWPEADIENKGLTASLHYRNAPDEAAARGALDAIAERARKEGFRARYGRKVLELLPPVEASKESAVRHLIGWRTALSLLASTGSSAGSTPATTRPTWTPSPRSTGSSSRCASPSARPRARPSSASAQTSSSPTRKGSSPCSAPCRGLPGTLTKGWRNADGG